MEIIYLKNYRDKSSHIPPEDYKKDTLKFTKKIWRFKKSEPYTILKFRHKEFYIQKDLYDFFKYAVLDETRLKKANAFAEYALYISDIEDLAYFRNTVTRREISAEIDTDRQRDHAAHTVYNYILGWYFFEHSENLRNAFKEYITKLGISLKAEDIELAFYVKNYFFTKTPKEFEESVVLYNEFGDVWPFASLLHDIGYILEGSISSASSEVEHARITNGAKIIHDYFNHYFWKVYDIDFRITNHIAKFLGVLVPDFKRSESLGSLGDHLCDTGTCEHIGKKLTTPIFSGVGKKYALSRNAFSIWNAYYEYVGKKQNNKKMQDILYIVERVFKNNIWVGADYGKRNLDHGVCSGLISLQALLFVRELFLGFKSKNKKFSDFEKAQINPITFFQKSKKYPKTLTSVSYNLEPVPYHMVSKETFDNIRDGVIKEPKRITIRYKKDTFNADDWFKKVCWATSSAAIHALIQEPDYRKEWQKHILTKIVRPKRKKEHLKIALKDDPLAFLGLLVDMLQEWDRYKVKLRGQSAFTGEEPLQSTEVELYIVPGNLDIIMSYPKSKADVLKKNINNCLEDWEDVVKLLKRFQPIP